MNESRPYEKITSFSKAPGKAQIASYITFILQVVLFYAIILPNLESKSQVAIGVLFSLSLIGLVITAGVCSVTDPSDEAMILYRNDREKFQTFRKNYDGKLLFCDHCMSYVKDRSRHCRACDRCVQNFDHHCMWINNCVGGLNYPSFFLMILSAFLHLMLYVVALAVLTYQQHPSLGGFVMSWISGGINVIFAFLLINLIVLHIYLICKGISTYEFIIAQREEEKRKKEEEGRGEQSQKVVYPDLNTHKRQDQENSDINIQERKHKKCQQKSENDPRVIQVRNNSEDSSNHGEIIFEQKSVTHKSDYQSESEQQQYEREIGESEGSVKVSQLLTRNKSLKLIIGDTPYYKPHQRINKQDHQKIKAHSMLN